MTPSSALTGWGSPRTRNAATSSSGGATDGHARNACSERMPGLSTRLPSPQTAASPPEGRTVRSDFGTRTGVFVVLRGHEDEITTAVFTSDGTRVLSSSQDDSLRLWDAHSGAALAILQSGQGEIYDAAVSSDGQIATLGKGEVVQVFKCAVCASLDEVRAQALSRAPRQLTSREREQFLAAAGLTRSSTRLLAAVPVRRGGTNGPVGLPSSHGSEVPGAREVAGQEAGLVRLRPAAAAHRGVPTHPQHITSARGVSLLRDRVDVDDGRALLSGTRWSSANRGRPAASCCP